MTIWDFLHQAGFWQWVGLIMLSVGVAGALAQFRPFTIRHEHKSTQKDEP